MTQGDLAKRVGVARQSIVALEKRNRNPSVSLAILLAKALHAEVEDLFFFDVMEGPCRLYRRRGDPAIRRAAKQASKYP